MSAEVDVVHLLESCARLLLRRLRLRDVPVPLPRLVEVLVRALVIRQTPVDFNLWTFKVSLLPIPIARMNIKYDSHLSLR